MEYQSAPALAPRSSKKFQCTVTTLVVGAVATVAFTVAVTLMLTQNAPASSAATLKFAPTYQRAPARSAARAAFGRKPPTPKKTAPAPSSSGGSFKFTDRTPPSPESFGEASGVLPPTGYLDPLGFGENASPARLRWFREAELKHGRIAMLAAVGFLIAETPSADAWFPGKASNLASQTFTDHQLDRQWYTIIATIGLLEVKFFDKFENVLDWKLKDDYAVGDLGFDPLGLKEVPGVEISPEQMRTKELQNGRLAMLAIAGFNAQELTDGKKILPIHGLGAKASAADIADAQEHMQKGLSLVKEMGQMLMDTAPHH